MENKVKVRTPDTKKFHPRKLGILTTALIMASILLVSCGGEIKNGSTVWITGDGANGTNPYSTNSAAPSDWRCRVPAGKYQVEAVDDQFDIIRVDNCWLSAANRNVKTTAPTTTTPVPTSNVWAPTSP